jgi:methionyl-tRNA synthetase
MTLASHFFLSIFAALTMFALTEPKRYTITAALPYANGPLHIGHIAGAYLPADIYVRYLRLSGKDVAFICGSDEHGAAITIRAKKEGITPQEIIDKYHTIIKSAFAEFGIEFDIYHRTSSELHHHTAQDFFRRLEKNNVFTKESTEQFYDEEHNQFLADRYITGTCPKCGNENAYGDQCEKCGSSLNPAELINPKSVLSGKTPVVKKTEHWYLPMDRYQSWINEFITNGKDDGKEHHRPDQWKTHVLGQCRSWIEAGLQPRAMTRDLDWGVKVPVEGADGKVLYVWLDAPIGYISATKQWAKEKGKNWEDYWKSDEAQLVHFIGKDNIVFHCIIFPILLKAHGEFILPANVPANEFLNLEGDKISTSRNWAVWLHEYLEEFPNRQDELRYVLISIAPESKDSEFTWKDYQARVNNELVAIFGNFVNRVAVLVHKYYNGVVPVVADEHFRTEQERILFNYRIPSLLKSIDENIEKFKFREALFSAMEIAREGNKYLADTEPWKLIKTDEDRTREVLFNALQISAVLAYAFKPFLPFTSNKLEHILNSGVLHKADTHKKIILASGHHINPAVLLFEKIEDEVINKQIEKLQASRKQYMSEQTKSSPQKSDITFDDFAKMDIRIGQIIAAEKVEKANKLLKLTIDTGIDKRTVVSGIAEYYKPEEIIGKKVSILVNLAPRNIRGVESQGMILMAENSEGKLSFVAAEDTSFENGGEIR